MGEHYYTAQPNVESNRHKWNTRIKGEEFTFYSDRGVFSKDRLDFGTKLMIESVNPTDYPEGNWLDMGCGYGPIGIALAKFNSQVTIEMVDINERAIQLARDNALLNKVENVEIHPSNLFEEVKEEEFAAIFSNPPIRAGKKVVHPIL